MLLVTLLTIIHSFSVAVKSCAFAKGIVLESVTFRQPYLGRYEDRLECLFEDVQLRRHFIITRKLGAIVGSKADHDVHKPRAPFVPRERATRQLEKHVVEGVLPPALKAIPYIGRLPEAEIPQTLSTALSLGSFAEVLNRVRRVYVPSFNGETYGRYFKHLLWIEEFRMEYVTFQILRLCLLKSRSQTRPRVLRHTRCHVDQT